LLMKIGLLAPDEPVKYQATMFPVSELQFSLSVCPGSRVVLGGGWTVNVLSQPKHDKYDIYESIINFDMHCAVKFSKLSTNVES